MILNRVFINITHAHLEKKLLGRSQSLAFQVKPKTPFHYQYNDRLVSVTDWYWGDVLRKQGHSKMIQMNTEEWKYDMKPHRLHLVLVLYQGNGTYIMPYVRSLICHITAFGLV